MIPTATTNRSDAKPVSSRIVSGIIRITDVFVVLLTGAVAYWIYLAADPGTPTELYYLVTPIGALLQLNLFQLAGLYDFNSLRRPYYHLGQLSTLWALLFFLLISAAFLFKSSALFSRGWTLIWFASGFLGLVAVRLALYAQIGRWRQRGRLARNIAIVGGGEHGRRLLQYLKQLPEADTEILGVFDDRADRVPDIIEGYPKLGTTDDLFEFARRTRVDEVFVALPWSAEARLLEILKDLRTLPVDVRLGPDLIGFGLPQCSFDRVGLIPTVTVFSKPLSDWKLLTKEIEDRVLATLILLFILPLMLVVAVLIKLDSPGPVLFRQKRFGFNNQVIDVYKFRSMRAEAAKDATVPQAKWKDPRITRVGRFLRRWSLDELPQFINVLSGEMSIVGPRPHAVPHNDYYANIIQDYASRHRVKPGITGWAQVNGWRGETDTVEKMQKRVEHDLYYIENWSIGLDLKIILTTAVVLLKRSNAY
ncbi:MAG: undecaprenyl-phosphate glucose phosphotransferase [Phycisphaerae bacterium]